MASNGYDVVFRNARIIDGTGRPSHLGDVAVAGDRIAAVGAAVPEDAERVLDIGGHAIAPGFIDAHTHDDRVVIDRPDMIEKISQGVTTVVTGNCGISLAPVQFSSEPPPPMNLLGGPESYAFPTMASYAAAVRSSPPAVNVVALIGHSALRLSLMDDVGRPAGGDEIAAMRAKLAQCLEEGASGFSTGLYYAPNKAADRREVAAVAAAAAGQGGTYATHMRNEGDEVDSSIEEAVGTAKQAGLPLVISHHKCTGPQNWGRSSETLAQIADARLRQSAHVDVYPYTAGSTVLRESEISGDTRILVTWSHSHPEMSGRNLAEIADQWGMTRKEAARALSPAGAIYFQMDEADMRRIMSAEFAMIGSDGLPHDAHPHPRLWGTFPRVIGRYARDLGLFSIETAVRKMSGLPAQVFGLSDRGRIAVGCAADLVVFDPATIIDRATYENPISPSIGIHSVYVNGVEAFSDGSSRSRAGRLLKGQHSS